MRPSSYIGSVAVRPEDLYDLAWASDPRVSPDGATVAYVLTAVDKEQNTYRSAIWVAAADGSTPPRQLTSGKKADGSPRWSPDGARLAFTSNRDGERKQLYVLPLEGGEPICLTELKEDAAQPTWSPDGMRHRLHVPCARPRVRGRGREASSAAPVHPPPLQARLCRLDGRSENARVRRAGGRLCSGGSAHRRRLRGRVPGVVSRLDDDCLRLGADRRLGRRP